METRAEGCGCEGHGHQSHVGFHMSMRMLHEDEGPFEVRVERTRRRDALAAASCKLSCELAGIPPQMSGELRLAIHRRALPERKGSMMCA